VEASGGDAIVDWDPVEGEEDVSAPKPSVEEAVEEE
jgi:hypothetical protein